MTLVVCTIKDISNYTCLMFVLHSILHELSQRVTCSCSLELRNNGDIGEVLTRESLGIKVGLIADEALG